MIGRLKRWLGRLKSDESGTASVEFVLIVPVYISLIAMSIELGFVTMRHTLLERGLDMAVRDIRLSTGTTWQHSQIKTLICDNALMILDCDSNLKLEMVPTDPRVLGSLNSTPQCTDQAQPASGDFDLTPGQPNQLMLFRACLKYNPLFPSEVLGSALQKDSSGQVAIVTMTAFAQEPL